MSHRTTRRGFLKTATVGATGIVLGNPSGVWSQQPEKKLNIALIGVGDRGRGFIRKVASLGQNLAAICDCDADRMKAAQGLPDGVRTFNDFRQCLEQMGDGIDSVIIATPHHTQPAIAAAAMRRGKHVFCEKPIGQVVGEARAMRELANKQKVVTQMGNQGVATDSFRRILEQVQDGAVGEIREAHQWYVQGTQQNRPFREPPEDLTRKPDALDWDLFVGPAPLRPYDYKFMRWSVWRDFGTGMLGMGGAHSCHMMFNAMNLRALWEGNGGAPSTIRVSAECSEFGAERFPSWEVVKFDFPARGKMPPARFNWYKGPQEDLVRPGAWEKLEKIAGRSLDWGGGWAPTSGSLVVGSKGVVHTNMHNSECALLPLESFPDQKGPPQKIPRAGSHEREWVSACLGASQRPFSNFDYAGPVIELLLLGNICTLLNRPIEFDPVNGKILNDDEANRALHPAPPRLDRVTRGASGERSGPTVRLDRTRGKGATSRNKDVARRLSERVATALPRPTSALPSVRYR